MAKKADAGESSRSSPSQSPPHPPLLPARIRSRGPDPFLIVCRCFSFVTATTALLCVAVNVLSAVWSFKDGNDVFDGIFRCYAIVIALFVAVAETEWGFIFKFWKLLEYWAARGMLQILYADASLGVFLSLISFRPFQFRYSCMEELFRLSQHNRLFVVYYGSYSTRKQLIPFFFSVAVMTRAFPENGQRKDLVLLHQIASYLLLACGLTYVISGLLCIGFLKRARQQKEITREQAAKDLEELERRREELEALLVAENV